MRSAHGGRLMASAHGIAYDCHIDYVRRLLLSNNNVDRLMASPSPISVQIRLNSDVHIFLSPRIQSTFLRAEKCARRQEMRQVCGEV